ncbi:hypothetical protein D3C72_1727790 [compost metagenome]
MLFGVVQDLLQQVARDIVTHRFAVGNAFLDGGLGALFRAEVARQNLRHVFAHSQLGQVLQIGQAVQREDAVHQPVGMLHLADGFCIFLLGQLVEAPVLEHAVVQKILVDGREFVPELGLQMANDLCVTFHGGLLVLLC